MFLFICPNRKKQKGDTLLIIGDLEPEWKFVSSTSFTSKRNIDECIEKNLFYPRILCATSGCIGAGLDSDDVHLVLRDGIPPSTLDLIQEMGRCGRGRGGNDDTGNSDLVGNVDMYHIVFSLKSYLYLIRRIHQDDEMAENERKEVDKVMKREEIIEWQVDDLNEVLFMLVCKHKCWHTYLQNSSSLEHFKDIRIESSDHHCNEACGSCRSKAGGTCMPVKKDGICEFLIQTFITNRSSGDISPFQLPYLLKNFYNVGVDVYGRRTHKAPMGKYVQLTILQLIATRMIVIDVNKNEKGNLVMSCRLGVTKKDSNRSILNYTIEEKWENIETINTI